MLTRIAESHLRVGSFQYAAASGDRELLRRLADHAIERHHPGARDAERPYLRPARGHHRRTGKAGGAVDARRFVHGVMNTDNMTISGETIDYGPCALMEAYDPNTVFSSIDSWGRYAYANQPAAAGWNLARFAETPLPLIDDDTERAIELAQATLGKLRRPLRGRPAGWDAGPSSASPPASTTGLVTALAGDLLDLLHTSPSTTPRSSSTSAGLPRRRLSRPRAVHRSGRIRCVADPLAGRWHRMPR